MSREQRKEQYMKECDDGLRALVYVVKMYSQVEDKLSDSFKKKVLEVKRKGDRKEILKMKSYLHAVSTMSKEAEKINYEDVEAYIKGDVYF